MATNRGFAYITGGTPINGCENVGNLLAGKPEIGYANTGLTWWGGADEELGWVVAYPAPSGADSSGLVTTPLTLIWDDNYKGPSISIIEDDTIVKDNRSGQPGQGQNCVMATKGIGKGDKLMFTLICDQTPATGTDTMFIGFATTNKDLERYLGSDSYGVGVNGLGDLWYGNNHGTPYPSSLPEFNANSQIDIAIDRVAEQWWYRVDGGYWLGDPNIVISEQNGLQLYMTDYYPDAELRLTVTCGDNGKWKIQKNHYSVPDGFQAWPVYSYVGFGRSSVKSDNSFVELAESITGTFAGNPRRAKELLNENGYWTSHPGIVTSNLALYLVADDPQSYPGTGDIWYDLSGNGNHVEMYNIGDVSFVGHAYNGYFNLGTRGHFRGENETMQNIPQGHHDYTISVWSRIPTGDWHPKRGLVSIGDLETYNQGNALLLNTVNNYQIINSWIGNDLTVEPDLGDFNGWLNIVARYYDGRRTIWVNGVYVPPHSSEIGLNVTSMDIQIGKISPVGTDDGYLEGDIAQVLIYNVGLTDAQIYANFRATSPKFG